MSDTVGIQQVRLYGALADTFGEVLSIYAETPAKAMTVIEANFYGKFFAHIRDGAYFIWLGASDDEEGVQVGMNDPDMLGMSTSHKTLHIMPSLEGAGRKKGGIMALLGAVVVGGAILLSGGSLATPLASLGAMQGTLWGTVAQIGVGIALQGIAQIVSPMPSFNESPNEEQKTSYLYSGPINTEYEGGAIALIYGAPYVGSVMVSGGIEIEKLE